MADLTGTEITLIAIVLVLAAILALVGVLLMQRLRRRRDQLRGELAAGGPAAASDRAFNRIAMARRELGVLRSQGADVARPSAVVAEAQAAFDLRQFDRAYERAQSAHEMLVNARQRPVTPTPEPDREGPAMSPLSSGAPPAPLTSPSPKLPAHRAEAQFQMRLLTDEVSLAKAERPSDGHTLASAGLLSQSQAAFDRAQYAEAFRLALKGRREVGGGIETVPLASHGLGGDAAATPTAEASAETAAAAGRCPNCGHPMLPDETFCRGCGSPRSGTN